MYKQNEKEFELIINLIKDNSPYIKELDLTHFELSQAMFIKLELALKENQHICRIKTAQKLPESIEKCLKENESTEYTKVTKQYGDRDSLQQIKILQQRIRQYNYHDNMEYINGISLSTQSANNVNALLAELKKDSNNLLSLQEKKSRGNSALTKEESRLLEEIRNNIFPNYYFLKHAASSDGYKLIKATGYIMPVGQLQSYGLRLTTCHTLALHGRFDCVYFSFGSEDHGCAAFVDDPNDPPHVIKVKLTSDIIKQLIFTNHYGHDNSSAHKFGETIRIMTQDRDPKGNKVTQVYNYRRTDGKVFTRTYIQPQQTVVGEDIATYLALRLIEELRYIGNPYRPHVLNNIKNPKILLAALNTLYCYPYHEIALPNMLDINKGNIYISHPLSRDELRNKQQKITLLRQAITDNDYDVILSLKEYINEFSVGEPLLNCAIEHNPSIVPFLLKLGADANKSNKVDRFDRNNTSLQQAIKNGHLGLVKLLLEWEQPSSQDKQIKYLIDLNLLNLVYSTPLVYAISEKHIGIIESILKNNRVVLTGQLGERALSQAINSNNPFLLEQILQINPDSSLFLLGDNCLSYAAEENYHEIIKILLKHGADPNLKIECEVTTRGYTPLMFAVKKGHITSVKALLADYCTNVNETDEWGYTALDKCNNEIIRKLLNRAGAKNGTPKTDKYFVKSENAVALVIVYKNGAPHVVVGRRKQEQYTAIGPYVLPGGGKDYGETFEEAAAREAFEETSVPLHRLVNESKCKPKTIFHYDQLDTLRDDSLPDEYANTHLARRITSVVLFDLKDMNERIKIKSNDDLRDVCTIPLKDIGKHDVMKSNRLLIEAAKKALENQTKSEDICLSKQDQTSIKEQMRLEYDGHNQLFNAIKNGDYDTAAKLLQKGACPNTLVNGGQNAVMQGYEFHPLFTAARTQKKDSKMIDLLLEHGANINVLLLYAIENKNKERLQYSITKGADINHTIPFIAIYNCMKQFNLEWIKSLIDNGLDLRLPQYQNIISRILIFLPRCKKSDEEVCAVFKLLLDNGFNINGNNASFEFKPITYYTESPKIIKLFLDYNTDILKKARNGKNAIDYALESENVEIIKLFISAITNKLIFFTSKDNEILYYSLDKYLNKLKLQLLEQPQLYSLSSSPSIIFAKQKPETQEDHIWQHQAYDSTSIIDGNVIGEAQNTNKVWVLQKKRKRGEFLDRRHKAVNKRHKTVNRKKFGDFAGKTTSLGTRPTGIGKMMPSGCVIL